MRARDQVVESLLHFFVQFISPNGGVGVADEKGHARQVQIIIIFFLAGKCTSFFSKRKKKRERMEMHAKVIGPTGTRERNALTNKGGYIQGRCDQPGETKGGR
jgi:hypothetical protein